MARPATIRIKNDTGYHFSLLSKDTTHGKFTTPPPQGIGPGTTGIFAVSTRTNAKIGPEGSVIYVLDDGISSTIQVYWHHPWAGESTYYGETSRSDLYTASPDQDSKKHPTGHSQDVTITFDAKSNSGDGSGR